ncbi:MAG: RNA polymerase sigma factor [Bacillota bacterium]|nr:RNA polymerase sigma factor [Bacillota bacterium]
MDYDKLIIETSKGNLDSLEKLYRDLGPAVFGLALSILRSRPLAEDVLQDTFVRVKLAAGTYKPGTNGRAWILTIARNTAISIIRSSRHETQVEELEAVESDGIDHMQKSIDSIILRETLSILDEQERQIVLLHAVKDLKHREIAKITDIPLGTVLWKYRRAIKKMSKYLEIG